MTGLHSYLISIAAASFLCSSVAAILGEKSASAKITKLISGVFLATVVLKPAVELKLSEYKYFGQQIQEQCTQAVGEGERMAENAILDALSEKTLLQITQEADRLGCNLETEIVWEEYTPASITLRGAASPYAKARLTKWISENIGITEGSQNWIG